MSNLKTSIITQPVFRVDGFADDGEAVTLLITDTESGYYAIEWMDTEGNDVVDLNSKTNHTHGGLTYDTVEEALELTIASVEIDDGEFEFLIDPSEVVKALA